MPIDDWDGRFLRGWDKWRRRDSLGQDWLASLASMGSQAATLEFERGGSSTVIDWAVWVVVSFICCQHHDMITRPHPLFPGHLVVATQRLDRKGKVGDGEQLLLTLFEWPSTGFNTFGFG